jgi:hypothetical protein
MEELLEQLQECQFKLQMSLKNVSYASNDSEALHDLIDAVQAMSRWVYALQLLVVRLARALPEEDPPDAE